MSAQPEPTDELLRGRRALDGIQGVRILEDIYFDAGHGKWIMKCRLHSRVGAGNGVPEESDWFIHLDTSYPWGEIKFYPAKRNGLIGTFPHQAYNGPPIDGDLPWLMGALCLETTVASLPLQGYDTEPYTVDGRLEWHCLRAIDWLELASAGQLLQEGEPFELPAYPPRPPDFITVGFSEDVRTLEQWSELDVDHGFVDLVQISRDTYVARSFESVDKKILIRSPWGRRIHEATRSHKGIWIKLPEIPTVIPWQAPTSWNELVEVVRSLGTDLLTVIQKLARHFRDGQRCAILLGFPIPAVFGEEPWCMHWQALLLPQLTGENQKGFQRKERSLWSRDSQILSSINSISWLYSRNWHYTQLASRGGFPPTLTESEIVLFGAGTVGSLLADKLVRSGAFHLDVFDDDFVEMGNLIRHTLGTYVVGESKALALATHLNEASPHANVTGHPMKFGPELNEDLIGVCRTADLIIDCTANDEVLHQMSVFAWDSPKLFVSVSVGFHARRLFIFGAYGAKFPERDFRELVGPWIEMERVQYDPSEMPWEGIGCWHPVFPARIDDISLMVSAGIKRIEQLCASVLERPTLIVYEQVWDGDEFKGIRMISKEESPLHE